MLHLPAPVVAAIALGFVSACSGGVPGGGGGEGEGEGEGEEGEGEGEQDIVFDYLEVPGSVCGNNTPAGLGVSDHDEATSLVVFVNGGGACWDDFTCFGLNSAIHLTTTYSDAILQSDLVPVRQTGLLDRNDATSPFRGAHYAFVPYCTGDLHTGTIARTYVVDIAGTQRLVQHKGRTNMVAFAAALADRYPDVTQLSVMGASAGGYGAVFNADVWTDAFPGARVDFFADGSPFVQPLNGLYGTWRNRWEMLLPDAAACPDCDTRFSAVWEHMRTSYEGSRFGLVTSTGDETIRLYFGYGIDEPLMTRNVNDLITAQHETDNSKAFVVSGVQHVLIGGYHTIVATNGVTLKSFVDGWATGGPGFATNRP